MKFNFFEKQKDDMAERLAKQFRKEFTPEMEELRKDADNLKRETQERMERAEKKLNDTADEVLKNARVAKRGAVAGAICSAVAAVASIAACIAACKRGK